MHFPFSHSGFYYSISHIFLCIFAFCNHFFSAPFLLFVMTLSSMLYPFSVLEPFGFREHIQLDTSCLYVKLFQFMPLDGGQNEVYDSHMALLYDGFSKGVQASDALRWAQCCSMLRRSDLCRHTLHSLLRQRELCESSGTHCV